MEGNDGMPTSVAGALRLPESARPGAKKALAEIGNAEDRWHALEAVTAFDAAYESSRSHRLYRPVARVLRRSSSSLDSFAHDQSHRIEAGLAIAFKLIESAQARWRAVNPPNLSRWFVPEPASNAVNWSSAPRRWSRDQPAILIDWPDAQCCGCGIAVG